jgi:hypothetical protein
MPAPIVVFAAIVGECPDWGLKQAYLAGADQSRLALGCVSHPSQALRKAAQWLS